MNNLPIYIPGLSRSTADDLYVNITGDTMTGALTVANLSNAINSADYPIQMKSGVSDGAGAVGYSFDTTNELLTSGSKILEIKSGGSNYLDIVKGVGSFATSAPMLDASNAAGGSAFASMVFKTGAIGTVMFEAEGVGIGKRLGVLPSAPSFVTESFGTDADPARIAFAAVSGGSGMFEFYKDTTNGLSFRPLSTGATLGANTGNTPLDKWGNAYFADNAEVTFGNAADATITYNTNNLVINPKVVGSGELRIQGDTDISGHLALGDVATISSTELLSAEETFNNPPVSVFGAQWIVKITGAATGLNHTAQEFSLQPSTTGTETGTMSGANFAFVSSSGTYNSAFTSNSNLITLGATIVDGRGFNTGAVSVSGEIRNYRGYYAQNFNLVGGTQPTLAASFWGEKQTAAVTNYGLVLDGDDAGADLVVGVNQASRIYGLNNNLILEPTGNVGIGTSTPKTNLHILTSGTSELGSVVLDRGVAITGIGGRSRIYFEATDSTSGERVFAINDEGGLLSFCSLNDTATAFINHNILVLDHDTGNVGIGTSTPISKLTVTEGELSIGDGNELRWWDTGDSNYVGFKAPALTADQIWTLPVVDGNTGDVMTTDGAGNLSFSSNASEKTWAISQVDGSGSHYIGGFYKFGSAANDFNPTINFGTANVSYAAHFFLVQAAGAAGGTDTIIRVTGTSIDDQGNRTPGDTQDLTVDDAGVAGTYYETTKKWLGQVAVVKISGPDLLCNYGFTKYWDNNNSDFKVAGIEATWTGGANDSDPDIILHHHKATGWTYNAGAAPTPPTGITQMNSDHTPEDQIANGENGAWKRDNLTTNISGSTTEGTIIELVTTAGSGKTYEIGNVLLRIVPQ